MRRSLLTGSATAAAVLASFTLAPPTAVALDPVDSSALRRAVTVHGILGHERVLQRIANDNGGTRASGTPGYQASVNYVKTRLQAAGYDVRTQAFTFPFFRETAPPELVQTAPTPTTYAPVTMQFSGSGSVTGTVVPTKDVVIPPSDTVGSTSGCEAADFVPASATVPQVALIQRGTCTFEQKAANAQAAGYDAVLIFNEGQEGRTDAFGGTLGRLFTLPVLSLSFDDGKALYQAAKAGRTTVRVTTSTEGNPEARTLNVIAETPGGNPDKVLVVGAHLDSVEDGPGINDNGSGTSTILEIAEELAEAGVQPVQKIRFAFWGAEESGLLGSEHYVASLGNAALSKIYANLNFDMLGSPNYARFVYDGDGSATGIAGPPGSGQIEKVFSRYFRDQGLASEPTEFSGRSDYGPFIAVGIPAGGLFSGAEGIKTAQQVKRYGGTAGEPYDACYHQACDTADNLNARALQELGDAAAHATYVLAMSRTDLFGDRKVSGLTAESRAAQTYTFDYDGSHLIR